MAEVRARVQLNVGKNSDIPAEIVSFSGLKDGQEHVALIFNEADKHQQTPLIRMHSECLTGDVFHSSRCDCGEQLNESIELMHQEGGILLYLRQEGRGIGLYNKLDAYVLQSQGMNTYEANNHLGFADDLREFSDAVLMLKALAVTQVKLMTNNPKKLSALADNGIDVKAVVGTSAHIKVGLTGNQAYLETKIKHGSHMLDIKKIQKP
ncbi:GTP cyclohydrolase II [Pseudoalteromonas ruthenica]|uniref:GTP cyclohydrolase II n=1 Tax=Pseudoalteromonas ruthenica TaxID=151081 RepID=A0A0F4PWI6_9GAMM|nr:GTP cyclohydrolase II [Pseudoalteromonas ruthenica]KJY97127.1 GTP cyclohydrolase [Pseudoalteromonas ruthenica]KJY99439.1 GTP cyclohydrolase [Pseudoalteromonas ruthenica]TMO86866.1 GTP cyclohydrolase II RibA [Pseudoalteromonas ruthenica]TMO93484.1 GTP cyclohydrolase II RibA [Pseudoalteromonas ruthenica]TMO96358.1 GTP cyclohydrolase II RibA [Pseudoalteromonas ruthenica]